MNKELGPEGISAAVEATEEEQYELNSLGVILSLNIPSIKMLVMISKTIGLKT